MIRLAELQDLPRVAGILMDAHSHMAYTAIPGDVSPDAESIVELLLRLLEAPEAGLFVAISDGAVVGAASAVLTPMIWNKHVLAATELFWHMAPAAYGTASGRKSFVALGDTLVEWASARGARWVAIITPEGPAGRLLERRGFSRMETNYGRAL